MKIVHLTYPVTQKITDRQVVLALGFFDGVHLGHQHLINIARQKAEANHLPLMVLTFDRHPSEVYAHDQRHLYIQTNEEKAVHMAKLGVDYLVFMHFSEQLSRLSGQTFVNEVLLKLQPAVVVAGFDYTYSSEKIADMKHLPKFAHGNFQVITVAKQTFEGKKIGSTEIKRAISHGEMERAYDLLGYHYVIAGKVGHGKRNGHKLGFPTANLIWNSKKVIPKIGVYATRTKVAGHWYDSMTSVGYNVTIGQEKKIYIESNLFNFDQDIYGQTIKVKWYKYTRGEVKFSGLPALKKQLQKDKAEIKRYFEEDLEK